MSRPLVSTFTADEVAPRWRISLEVAEEFLAGFREAGLVVRVGRDGWQVTPKGYRLGCDLSHFDERRAA